MVSSKTKVDNLGVDKLKIVPANLSKASDVVDNDVVIKTLYDILVIKNNTIDNKIPSSSGLLTKAQYD